MSQQHATCPVCGEPVREKWKFCPTCETPLGSLVCPRCKSEVKENWKRCPECEAILICKSCGRRIPWGQSDCPVCRQTPSAFSVSEDMITEPVTGTAFVRVSDGKFMMGDVFDEGGDNEKPVHEVALDGFYLGKYPVTQAQSVLYGRRTGPGHTGRQLEYRRVECSVQPPVQLSVRLFRPRAGVSSRRGSPVSEVQTISIDIYDANHHRTRHCPDPS